MIQIIQGVYGHLIDGRVYPKDSESDPFELTPEEEQRLVKRGVAVYADKGQETFVSEGKTIPEYNMDMKVDELREIGKQLGITFKVGTTKAEMIEEMDSFLSENPISNFDTGQDAEGSEQELPAFDAAEAVQ